MLLVHVHIQVRQADVPAFIAASLANARASVREPGIIRFDVIQQADDASRFLFVEMYRGVDDAARHKATAHYATWRDTVEPMMADARKSVKYGALFPADAGWEMPG